MGFAPKPPDRHTLRDWALLGSLVVFWGTAFVFTGIAVDAIPPATVAASRILIAALVLGIGVTAAGLRWPREPAIWLHLLGLGVLGNALPFFLISWGQERVPSGVAGLIMGVMPLATFALAHRFLPGERLTTRRSLGLALGLMGVATLLGPGAAEVSGTGNLWRHMAILGGAVCYASNSVLSRFLPPLHAAVASAGSLAMASVVIVPVALIREGVPEMPSTSAAWWSVVWLGLVATASATVVYFAIIRSAGPTFLSLINYLIPGVALFAGVTLLGESLHAWSIGALGLILAGVALAQRTPKAA